MFRCQGGNAQLAHKLASTISDGAQLHLETAVREINFENGKATVRDARGDVHEADDVVLAIPPSTWRQIYFDPELPRALRPQMGTNVKFLATMKRRFWRKNRIAPESLTDGIASMTWEGTDNQGDDSLGAELTAFFGGPAAERARRSWTQEQDAGYLAALEKVYPGFREEFVRGRFMDWPNEQWTAAGYSFPASGQVTTVGPILRAGLGRLHFAGEHACYNSWATWKARLTPASP